MKFVAASHVLSLSLSLLLTSSSNIIDASKGPSIEKWTHMEHANMDLKPHLQQGARANPDVLHRVMFARKQRNMDMLKEILMDVSHPQSSAYGQHMTRDAVAELTSFPEAEAAIKSFLAEHSITVSRITRYGDYISAVAPISKWEEIFQTEFFEFKDLTKQHLRRAREAEELSGTTDNQRTVRRRQDRVLRALSYSLPDQLVPYVQAVYYTIHMPVLHNLQGANVERVSKEDSRYQDMYAQLHRSSSGQPIPTALDDNVAKMLRGTTASTTGTTSASAAASAAPGSLASAPMLRSKIRSLDIIIDGYVTPDLIDKYYDVHSNTGSQSTSQAVFATLGQTVSPSDLEEFQDYFNLPEEDIAEYYGGYVDNNACSQNTDDCIEANLDVQYIMAISQNVPTTWYYWDNDDPWLSWIEEVADMNDPPIVWSISYGSYEDAYTQSYLDQFSTEAIKLAVAGVTITAAAGDDGVAGFLARDGTVSCDYWPMFPASNPYVVAVGGTMGPEDGDDEVTCQSDKGSSITTGGGFSTYYSQDSFQNDFVDAYFDQVDGTSKEPDSGSFGYKSNKRAFPDVALLANNYLVMADDELLIVSGTSASSPVFAAMVALVNSARVDKGNSTLGWLNPLLYSDYAAFAKDVTSGDNKCLAAGYGCCSEGFYAMSGWDPVTGLGSIDFDDFLLALANEQSVAPNSGDDDDEDPLPLAVVVVIIVIALVAVGFVAWLFYYCFCIPKKQYSPAGTPTAENTIEVPSVPATVTAVTRNPSHIYYD